MSVSVAESHATGLRSALATLRRTFAPADHLALWTLTLDGAVAGALLREGGSYRLDLVGREAETRDLLANADGIAVLENQLSARLGGTVRLQAVAA
ncbi:MAG: hypothetical protein JNK84_16440 [Phreatobacter sp.]|uniref:hypothetical protein n=1 Tax=Phreatobacter sp. TaxID=1966341 RepID=UPI001A610E73|nr:hypothetical protein [Phreatobacter sp.]MBL8570662.1 hypothetical protein [Phreatobacter sp.]